MRLIVPDSVLTTYLAAAAERLAAGDLLTPSVGHPDPVTDADAAVLVATGDLGAWVDTHHVVPTVGVATNGRVGIALGTPVRADMIEEPGVWLRDVSATARLLVRATFERYYGTPVREWTITGEGAQAVVIEGVEALQPPETGFRDDLGRAWFILNGVPVVTHLLLVPHETQQVEVEEATRWVQQTGGLDKERRRKARERLAAQAGMSASDLVDLLAAIRTTLEPADLAAAKLLYQLARDPELPTPPFTIFGHPSPDICPPAPPPSSGTKDLLKV